MPLDIAAQTVNTTKSMKLDSITFINGHTPYMEFTDHWVFEDPTIANAPIVRPVENKVVFGEVDSIPLLNPETGEQMGNVTKEQLFAIIFSLYNYVATTLPLTVEDPDTTEDVS